jgi:hypothetical protein
VFRNSKLRPWLFPFFASVPMLLNDNLYFKSTAGRCQHQLSKNQPLTNSINHGIALSALLSRQHPSRHSIGGTCWALSSRYLELLSKQTRVSILWHFLLPMKNLLPSYHSTGPRDSGHRKRSGHLAWRLQGAALHNREPKSERVSPVTLRFQQVFTI